MNTQTWTPTVHVGDVVIYHSGSNTRKALVMIIYPSHGLPRIRLITVLGTERGHLFERDDVPHASHREKVEYYWEFPSEEDEI